MRSVALRGLWGRKLRTIAKNIVVKVPLTPDGLRACKTLDAEGHPVWRYPLGFHTASFG